MALAQVVPGLEQVQAALELVAQVVCRWRRRLIEFNKRLRGGASASDAPRLDRVIAGIRIEVIDASDLQPRSSVSRMRNPASSRGRGSLVLGCVGCVSHWF